jgi:hypothetical protein
MGSRRIEPEQFVAIAVSALEQGFDGTALRQLAGLSRPTSRDLGTLPERVRPGGIMAPAKGKSPAEELEAVLDGLCVLPIALGGDVT